MWREGLHSVKRGLKCAHLTCLSILNGLGSLLENRVFHPFLTHFWSQNGPFSRHSRILHGPKRITTGSKWAKNTCLSIASGSGSILEKCVLHSFLSHFWSQNRPFSRHFGIFHVPKRVSIGSKWAKNTCLSSPNGSGSLLEKCGFHPFLTHFWPKSGPFSRHFGIFHGPKHGTMGSKGPKNTCVNTPSGLRTTLEKAISFRPGGPTVGPNRARAVLPSGCSK